MKSVHIKKERIMIKLYCNKCSNEINVSLISHYLVFKSPPTMWWWRLIVFVESARRRRHSFLLSLGNPYSDYFQIFAVCILALETLLGFFLRFSVFSSKSKMAAKILWRTLELKLLHRFVSCLV